MNPTVSDRILLVEDDEQLGKQIAGHLEGDGLLVDWLRGGDEAMLADPHAYGLIVLDLMLPGAYGLDVLKRVRGQSDVPVLILSARNETPDKVKALRLGADDYLTKPFWPSELLARVRARLRRPVLQRADVIHAGGLRIDLAARRVEVDGAAVALTRVEFDLLAALARRAGSAVARPWLVDAALDPDKEGSERTLDVHVSRLRRKLGACGRRIATVWNIGYRLDREPRQ